MCGLVGMAGDLTLKEEKMFEIMLILDVVRGKDSTGVAAVDSTTGKLIMDKELGHPLNLLDKKSSALRTVGQFRGFSRCFIGHNRAATLGAVDVSNAHPFTFGDITGAHNGTLRNWMELDGYAQFDVDSKALFSTINNKGIEHTWKSFTGAAAITYWDANDLTLNIVRNSERPLVYAEREDEKAFYWASEAWMITVAASKAGVKLKSNPAQSPIITAFTIDTHYKVAVDKDSYKIMSKKTLEKKNPPTTYMGGTHGTTGFRPGYSTYTSSTHKSQSKKEKKTDKLNNGWAAGLLKGDKSFRGQEGKLIGVSHSGSYNYAVLELDDGSVVRVYPTNGIDLSEWYAKLNSPSDMYFKLLHRPRIKKSATGTDIYNVGHAGVKFTKSVSKKGAKEETKPTAEIFKLYQGPDGPLVKEDWEEAVRKLMPSCSCSNCLSPLDIEDHRKILWAEKYEAYCPDCAENPGLMTQLMYAKTM